MTPLPFLAAAGRIVSETYNEFVPFQLDRSSSYLERKYTNEHSQFMDVADARMHYRIEGNPNGETIVCLHGTYSSLHTWDGWVEELGDEFQIVRLDMPGMGLTGPFSDTRHTLGAIIDAVIAFADELGIEDAVFAGNSLGGGIAWRVSTDRPDLASKLLLINSGGSTLLAELSKNLVSVGTDLVPRYFTPRMVIRLLLMDAYADNSKLTDECVHRYHDLLLHKGNRRAVVDISRNYMHDHFDEDVHELVGSGIPTLPSMRDPLPKGWDGYDMRNITKPTLFQWGEDDEWLPVTFGRALSEKVTDSQFIRYENVGHIPMEEAPKPTARDASTFITEHNL
jgi:pimeloyl-ACP methyl ester carboxylesterase